MVIRKYDLFMFAIHHKTVSSTPIRAAAVLQNSSHDIIQAILAARRLLSEHVDVLHLLADVETQRQTSPSALSVIGTATVTVLSAATAAICARRL